MTAAQNRVCAGCGNRRYLDGLHALSAPFAVSRSLSLRALLPVLLITFTPLCEAQGSDESSDFVIDDDPIEEIVVTGTRIKRRDFVTASPLTTVSSEQINQSAQSTIEETLNRMPQVLPVSARTTWDDGAAKLDLRGLGPGRALVLLNGRRMAPTGVSNAVDLNNIPRFLIDRVEIITGGTSATYGSDAIAGVVNFITREDLHGLEAEAGFSMSEQGDAESYDLNAAYGFDFSGGRGSATIFGNFIKRQPLTADQREYTSTQYYDSWEGYLISGGSWSTPAGVVRWPLADLGDGPVYVTFDPDGVPREFQGFEDSFNYQPATYLQIPLDRLAAGVMGHYQLSEQVEAYLEAMYVRNEPVFQNAPAPAWIDIEVNIDNPVLTPEAQLLFASQMSCAPDLACFSFSNRFPALGQRRYAQQQDYKRILAGLRGELAAGWEFDGWITYTGGSTVLKYYNGASRSRYLQGLLVDPATGGCFDPAGGCVPLNVFGEGNLSPEGAEFIRLAPFQNRTEQEQWLASIFITGSPVKTWAGPADIALGAEWRRDDTYFKAADVLFSGEALSTSPSATVEGSEDVYEVYAEAAVPLATDRIWADYLGLEVGGRYSKYSHAGGVWTYKAGAKWSPTTDLQFRAMYQRSTRAPNSDELFQEQNTEVSWWLFAAAEDPCSASADPVGSGVADKCLIQGLAADQVGVFEATEFYPVNYVSGGNPDLRPEIGETWTIGAVLSPGFLPNLTFAIDYYSLKVTDTIGGIDALFTCFDPTNTSATFCDRISRDSTGNVSDVVQLTSNRGLMKTTGFDAQISYQIRLPGYLGLPNHDADLKLNVYWTHMLSNREQEGPSSEPLECAGYFGWPCDTRALTYPRNRITTYLNFESGPLGINLDWRWIDGTRNAAPLESYIYGVDDPDLAIPVVKDQHYVDLGIRYDFGGHYTARFGIDNLFNNRPPLIESENNTDAGLYDVFGRSYYLTLWMHL